MTQTLGLNESAKYWETVRYRNLGNFIFHNETERSDFKKLLGCTLYTDPLLAHFIVAKQCAFLAKSLDLVRKETAIEYPYLFGRYQPNALHNLSIRGD